MDNTMDVIDLLITAFLIFTIVMFLIGKGDTLMEFFSNSKTMDIYKEYDHDKLNRATLIFCIFLLLDQLGITFLGDRVPYWGIITVIVTVAIFVIFVVYLRKCARNE